MKNKKIGWIGTGIMGKPMAMHLLNAGYSVNVNNRILYTLHYGS
jgi:3-hydroxyisobutyrate dehydrogenase